jgi:adenylate cyclase
MWGSLSAFVFGRPVDRKLPARVRDAIRRQQVQAEILIGWTQVLLVLFFLALYLIAPRPAGDTPFHPVPWVLSAFLVFTVIRLLLAYRRVIAAWFLCSSVVLDIGLLLLLIWSFHIQYMQPAAFYLKAPTLLYVFLFIALRALRFDPIYVLVAGASAAAGWAVLVFYALAGPPPASAVTRDYVLYITSNSILIGAEVDKIICILLVTAVLAVAIVRARRLLMQSVADATVARELTRFVAPELASHVARAERAVEPGDGRVITASILFCDIQGFSTFAERMSPERLMRTLNAYFAVISGVVDEHGGTITAYQGDAMLIGFNTALPDPDHAANALHCALGIQRVLAERRFDDGMELRTRCGINTGPLVAGAVGTNDRLLFTVYGDEVNIAARLEQLNKSLGTWVLASEQTVLSAGDGFVYRAMGEVLVRGRSRPVAVYAIDGVAAVLPLTDPNEGDAIRRGR